MSSMAVGLVVVVVVVAMVVMMMTRNASVSEVQAALKVGAKVIDVRSTGEFREGHFQGAVNIPLEQLPGRLRELGDPALPLVLHCHSGMRSGSALHIVRKAGYTKAVNAGTLDRVREAAGKGK